MLQLELITLYAFALVLPMLEAPKNLLWVLYAVLWIVNRARKGGFGGAWTRWDTAILVWIVSGYGAAAFAGVHNSEWLSAFDILRYGTVLWMLKRSGYDPAALNRLLFCIIAGTAAALARGGYELWFTKEHATLGLNSVGHVNHSAIYVAITFIATVAWSRAAWGHASLAGRILGLILNAGFVLALFVMASRGAVGAAFIAALAFLVVYSMRAGKHLKSVLVIAAISVGIVLVAKPQVIEKNEARVKENLFLAYRDGIWRAGFEAWRQFPVFGVGMGNFGRIDLQLLEEWSHARGGVLDSKQISLASHGHSLYVNTLAERGAVGLLALLAVLAMWAWDLARRVPRPNSPAIQWAYWGGALGAWLIATIVGMVNTTLHHEHALISMLLLGGWLALKNQEPATQ
ncbi:MAG: O-antigen ligase family protein [Proteobacteria bacterium]|nr:O-antigen ligase family protein [Pseudomonadota bacterium]